MDRDPKDVAYFVALDRALCWKAIAHDAIDLLRILEHQRPGLVGGDRVADLERRSGDLVKAGA